MTPSRSLASATTSAAPSNPVVSLSNHGKAPAARPSTCSGLRWSISAAAALAVLALSAPAALAQQKTLYVAGYGGSFEQTMRKEIFPAFEAKHGVKVEYVAGNSTDTLAKLQAQKGNQQIDVAIVDDGPMYQAIQLGFCGKIAGPARRRSLSTPPASRTTRPSPSASSPPA